jgi:NADH-quinone oxidoreductase subunit L
MALGAAIAGATVAIVLYRNRQTDPIDLAPLRNRFYFDELYRFLIRATQGLLARLSAFIDRWILDGAAIRGASATTWGLGSLLRLFQVGNLQGYAFLFGLGIVGLIYFTIFR